MWQASSRKADVSGLTADINGKTTLPAPPRVEYNIPMATHSESNAAADSGSARIVSTPGTCGGKPRIDGTRVRVQDVMIWHERSGLSADEIVRDYPYLNIAQVYAALSYYYDHQAEIDAHLKDEERVVQELMRGSRANDEESPGTKPEE